MVPFVIPGAVFFNRPIRPPAPPDPTFARPTPILPARPDPAVISAIQVRAAERGHPAVSGAAVGCPGEGVPPPFSLIGTKETAP